MRLKKARNIKKRTLQMFASQHRPPKPTKLIQEVRTRWNSTFYILERFLHLHKAANRVLADSLRSDLQLQKEEMELVQDAVDALRPFEEATREMSGEKFTTLASHPNGSWLITPDDQKLEKKASPIVQQLQDNLCTRFSCPEGEFLWSSSTYLDPRFKQLSFARQYKSNLEGHKSRLAKQFKPVTEPEEMSTDTPMIPPVTAQPRPDSIWESHDEAVQKEKQNEIYNNLKDT